MFMLLLTLSVTLPVVAWIDFLIVRHVWRAVTGQTVHPQMNAAEAARRRESRVRTALLVFSALGLAGCLWPCAVVNHSDFGVFGQAGHDNEPGFYVNAVNTYSIAARAGVEPGDRILSIGGWLVRMDHVNDIPDPQTAWQRAPETPNVPIRLERDGKEIVLHAVRAADPVYAHRLALWQVIGGAALLLIAGYVLLGLKFPRTSRWRGLVVSILCIATLVVIVLRPIHPSLVVCGWDLSFTGFPETIDAAQWIVVCLAAFALLLLGVLEIPRAFSRKSE